eukprot:12391589-Alexandrium_andersonii.AAC.1
MSIPQGCPLSMLWLNVVLLPVLKTARVHGTVPRSLADDVSLVTTGVLHWRTLRTATKAVMSQLAKQGSKISAEKSFLFSTSPAVRGLMRGHEWEGQARMKVVLHARDLGAHVSFAKCMRAPTWQKRVRDTCVVLRRAEGLPMSHHMALKVAR